MPRKVFISFLGTSYYKHCEYTKDGQSWGRTRYIQEATFRYLSSREEWNAADRILILLTKQAEMMNWNDGGQIDKDTKEPFVGLASCLSQFKPVQVDTLRFLPEGVDEGEIWTLFSRIYDYLQEGDNLYFDITHGFRYLPMLVLTLGNYAKFLKKVEVRSISYGNWEISQNGERPAPIIDLMPLSALQDWTYAAGQILENGNANELFKLSRGEYIPLLQASQGRDGQAQILKNFADSLKHLVDDCRSCRGLSIMEGKTISLMRNALQSLPESTLRPYYPIFQKIAESFEPFSGDSDPLNGFHVAKWCFEKGLYQQAATYLEEAILYHCCLDFNLDPLAQQSQRLISGAFDYAANRKNHKSEKTKEDYSVIQKGIGEILSERYEALITPYAELRETIRNDFNHAGIRKDPRPGKTLIQRLGQLVEIIPPIFLKEAHSRKPVFVNISNHPSGYWSEKQLAAAKAYGEIIDVDFPSVDPEADEERIKAIADNFVKEYLHFLPSECTFHIMGEMTLTHRLINMLKLLGFRCLASTTKRRVRYGENGEKIVDFDFIQFREY